MSYTLTSSPTVYAATNGFKYLITCAEGLVTAVNSVTGNGSYSLTLSGTNGYISGGVISTYLTAPVQLTANVSITTSPAPTSYAITSVTSSVITATSSHFTNGQTVIFTTLSGTPVGIVASTVGSPVNYYVVSSNGSTSFQVSATAGGTPITISGTATGNIQLSPQQTLNTQITLSPLALSGHLIPAPYGQSVNFPLSNLITLPPVVSTVNISSGYTVTGTNSTKTLIATGSSFTNGSTLVFTALTFSGGSGSVYVGTTYYVINASGTSFQLATSYPGGSAIAFGYDIIAGSTINQTQLLDIFLTTVGSAGHIWDYSPSTGIVSCPNSDLGGGVASVHTPTLVGVMFSTTAAYGNDNGSGGVGSYLTVDKLQLIPGVNPTVAVTDGTNQQVSVQAITGVTYTSSVRIYSVSATSGATVTGSFDSAAPNGLTFATDGTGYLIGYDNDVVLPGSSKQFPFTLVASSSVNVTIGTSTETTYFTSSYSALLNLFGQNAQIIGPVSASTTNGVPVSVTVQTSPSWSTIVAAGLSPTVSVSGLSPSVVLGNVITSTPTLTVPTLMQVLVGTVTVTVNSTVSSPFYLQVTVIPTSSSNTDIDLGSALTTIQNNRNAVVASTYDALVTYLSLNKSDMLHNIAEAALARFCGQTAAGDWFPTYSRYNSAGPIQDGDSLAQSIKRLQNSKNQNITIYEPGGLKATAISPTPAYVVVQFLSGSDDDFRLSLINGSTMTTLFDTRRYGSWSTTTPGYDNTNATITGWTMTIAAGTTLAYHAKSPAFGSLAAVDATIYYTLVSGTVVQIDTFNAQGPTTGGGYWTGTVYWTDGSNTTYKGGGLGGNGNLVGVYFPNGSFTVQSDWYDSSPSAGSTIVPDVGVTNPSQIQIGNSLALTVVDQLNGVVRLDAYTTMMRGAHVTFTPTQTRTYTIDIDATLDLSYGTFATVYPMVNGVAVAGAGCARFEAAVSAPFHLCFQRVFNSGSLYTLGIGIGVSSTNNPTLVSSYARILVGTGSNALYPPTNYSSNELVSVGTCTYDPTWKIT